MMTASNLIEKWKLLSVQAAPSDLLRVCPEHPLDIYVRLASTNDYELLIVSDDIHATEIFTSGLKNISISVSFADGVAKICLSLGSLKLLNTFASMCSSLISRSSSGSSKTEALIGLISELNEWVELLKRKQDGAMTRMEAIGLWGELSVIRELIRRDDLDAGMIIQSWRGPNGDQTDVGLNGKRIEIKTQLSTKTASLRISSLEQLDGDYRQLYVVLNRISTAMEGVSLCGLVEDIYALLSPNLLALGEFEKKIEISAYSPNCKNAQESYMLDHRYVYAVDESFPKLTRGNVPIGIDSAEYVISARSISDYQISWENMMGACGV